MVSGNDGGSIVVVVVAGCCSICSAVSTGLDRFSGGIDSLVALVASVATVLFSVTTVAVLIVLSLGTKVAPKWAEKRVFYCGNTAQNITLWLYYAIFVQNS